MKFVSNLWVLAVVVCLSSGALAQFDTNGANAALTINGNVPSAVDAADHDVNVAVPGILNFTVDTGANAEQGVILIYSPTDPTTGNVFATPWGGSLDVGTPGGLPQNVVIAADGINNSVNPQLDPFFRSDNGNANLGTNPQMLFVVSVGSGFCGQRAAYQCIVQDPAAAPFFFDNTEAADVNYVDGQDLIALTGDDGVVTVAFSPGKTFPFHGVNYADVNLCGNGFMSFGAPTSAAAAGFTIDVVSWVNAEPSIAPVLADWSPGLGGPLDGVYFSESGDQLLLSWGHPNANSQGGVSHFADSDLNQFGATLSLDTSGAAGCGVGSGSPGDFTLDHQYFDPNTVAQTGSGVIGHTPGGAAITGGAFDQDLSTPVLIGLTNEAMIEEHDNLIANASYLGYDGAGSRRDVHEMRSWGGQGGIQFLAQTLATPGDNGYLSLSLATPDLVDGTQGGGNISDAGNENVVIVGKFHGFDPSGSGAGTVVFDPGGANINWTVIGILEDAGSGFNSGALSTPTTGGSLRNGPEGLSVITHAGPIAGGIYNVDVNFASGYSGTISVNVVSAGTTYNSYTIIDDGFATHALTVPINYYGATYNTAYLSSNGFVTFGAGSGDFTATMPEFFGGWGAPVNAGVCLHYSDNNNGGTASGSTYDVNEDTTLGTVQFLYLNQNWWGANEPAGNTTCTMDSTGSVSFDWTGHIAAVTSTEQVIYGVTDGDPAVGTDTDLTLSTPVGIINNSATGGGGYASAGGNDSVGEMMPATGSTVVGAVIQFLETGVGQWVII